MGRTTTTIILGVALALAGCYSMRPVAAGADGSEYRVEVRPGDHVTALMEDGARPRIEVTEVGALALTGRRRDGSTLRLAYADIAFIELRRRSPARTAGAIGAGVLFVIVGGVVTGVIPMVPPP